MSSRWYPIYRRGNPQLRVFLPNFWLKVVRPRHPIPPNVVQFGCSMEMTKYDIKNYLEKIYKLPVIDVKTRIELGKTKRDPGAGYVIKQDDLKLAYVTLPKDTVFVFPDIFPISDEKRVEDDKKTLDQAKEGYQKYLNRNKGRPGTPGWYSF